MDRNKAIVRVSLVGIGVNLLLAAFKFAAGLASGSVSILSDAVNNFTDMLSCAITILGTRLSEKEPDRKHPFGYGRVEYLASLLIGIIILYAGFDTLRHSVFHLLHPKTVEYSAVTLLVIAAAILCKVHSGLYMKKRGRALQSPALTASGNDALMDTIVSSSTLAAALLYIHTGISIEAWVGAVISLVVLRTGFATLREPLGGILGQSADVALAKAVRDSILQFPEVEGVYNIVIHSYGSRRQYGSAHVELSDRLTVAWIDNFQRAVTRNVRKETGVEMLGLSIYAINTQSEEVIRARNTVQDIVAQTEGATQLHGFYIDAVDRTMSFDVVLEFGVRSRGSLREELTQKVLAAFPDYDVEITVDYDFTA